MTGSHLQVRLAPVKCRECIVWENETKGGQKYLTAQMNGEQYVFEDSIDEQPGQLHPQPGGTGAGRYRLAELRSDAAGKKMPERAGPRR